MTKKRSNISTEVLSAFEPGAAELEEIAADAEQTPVDEEKMKRGHERLMAAIKDLKPEEEAEPKPGNGVTISHERYTMLKKMEDAAQYMAEMVGELFTKKNGEARTNLILKAAEVLRINPRGHAANSSGSLASVWRTPERFPTEGKENT